MREHEFVEGKCRHCGGNYTPDLTRMSCIWRPDPPAAPRAIPPSVIYDHAAIGDHLRELQAARERAWNSDPG